jgi:hypothetical protein
MKLYRICHENEAKTILEGGDYSTLGNNYYGMFRNTYDYEYGKKYLHFFSKLGNIYYLNLHKNNYFCEYEIPDDIIPQPSYGYYMDYVSFHNQDRLEEYIIESSLIKHEYLTKMERITEFIDYEDYLYGDLPSKFELVYEKDSELKYEKKLYQDE